MWQPELREPSCHLGPVQHAGIVRIQLGPSCSELGHVTLRTGSVQYCQLTSCRGLARLEGSGAALMAGIFMSEVDTLSCKNRDT